MDLNYHKVEGHSNLIRDVNTNAIVNTNMSEYENYKSLKKIKDAERERMKSLENDVNEMKNDLNEIKSLLRLLTNGSK